MANITAEDPDDEGFPGRLLYSITTVSSYFVIDQRESSTTSYPVAANAAAAVVCNAVFLPGTWPAVLSRFSLRCQGKDVRKATSQDRGA